MAAIIRQIANVFGLLIFFCVLLDCFSGGWGGVVGGDCVDKCLVFLFGNRGSWVMFMEHILGEGERERERSLLWVILEVSSDVGYF